MQSSLVFAGDDKVSFITLLYSRLYLHNFMSLVLFPYNFLFEFLGLKELNVPHLEMIYSHKGQLHVRLGQYESMFTFVGLFG